MNSVVTYVNQHSENTACFLKNMELKSFIRPKQEPQLTSNRKQDVTVKTGFRVQHFSTEDGTERGSTELEVVCLFHSGSSRDTEFQLCNRNTKYYFHDATARFGLVARPQWIILSHDHRQEPLTFAQPPSTVFVKDACVALLLLPIAGGIFWWWDCPDPVTIMFKFLATYKDRKKLISALAIALLLAEYGGSFIWTRPSKTKLPLAVED
ncbi:hypothetical protein llap_10735 [Limosa lapponica baueri]|uniref:Uncharacterized protein n=1 Tax=Limosa lapponica baueri TaxID=1758121 RepID=A0A2I0TYW0_LIMLA|nr:hypothetical protein llap_10735 [Limosa lapponica baueri]